MGVEALAIPLGHHLALVQDHEGEGRPVVGVVVDQGLGDGREPRREGGVAGLQEVRAFGLGGEGILLRLEFRGLLAAEQRDAVSFAPSGDGLAPEEAARHRLVLEVHLVAGELDEGEVEVEGLHVRRFPPGDENVRRKVLGRIARDDGQQGVQVEAAADERGREHRENDAQDRFLLHFSRQLIM